MASALWFVAAGCSVGGGAAPVSFPGDRLQVALAPQGQEPARGAGGVEGSRGQQPTRPPAATPPANAPGEATRGAAGSLGVPQGQGDKDSRKQKWAQIAAGLQDGKAGLQDSKFLAISALAEMQALSEMDQGAKEASLEGFNFGTGIAVTFDLHSGSRISEASLADSGSGGTVVRVDEKSDVRLGLVLETHYFWFLDSSKLVGIGPFVAIRTSDEDPIDEAGLGLMIGFRREKESTSSFNLGFGLMLDPDAKVLADGYEPNQAPPVGATAVQYKSEERVSFAVLFSYTF